jgi:hypothetical protein
MITTPLETRVLEVIANCHGFVPADQLDDMSQLVRSGEPGVALENLATQLYEYDALVSEELVEEMSVLCKTMGLNAKYWSRLARE